MSINATLRRLVISSPQVSRLADFYTHAFDYQEVLKADEARCEADDRSLWIRPGSANQLLESHFVFPDVTSLEHYAARLQRLNTACRRVVSGDGISLAVEDPEGRLIRFSAARAAAAGDQKPAATRPGRLQHYAVRTPGPQALVDFYANALGFSVSDFVRDDAGNLTAAFLRTDAHHHSLAIFRSSECRLDHFSCETRDWSALRDWADHMASCSIRLAWGVGRHGPGNDTFFMVLDPDGNLAEISSDLELCAEDRPVGTWKHSMETLNQWGVAIMRS
jgi:catechol 2,3-dioxygenase